MKLLHLKDEIRISLYYLLFGGIWIALSDRLLGWLVQDARTLTMLQTYKGWFFVAASGLLIYVLLHRALQDERRTLADLDEVNERYRLLFENSLDAVLLTTPDGGILSANPAACRMLGRSEEQIRELGRNGVVDLSDPRLPLALEQRAMTGKFTGEFNLLRSDGKVFPCEIASAVFNDKDGQTHSSMIIRDISERKSAEARIRKQVDFLTALRDIDRAIASTFDVHLSLSALLLQARSHLAVDAAAVMLTRPGSALLEYAAGVGFKTTAVQSATVRIGESLPGRAVLERQVIHIHDLGSAADDPLRAAILRKEGFIGYHAAPLTVKGRVIGVMELFDYSGEDRDQEWLDFLNTLAGQAALAVDNARMFDDVQRSNIELAQAYDATIEGWSKAMDLRDKETEGHTLRVTGMTLEMARLMGMEDLQLLHIRRGALLHDIGKMGVPDHILFKTETLTPQEWEIMKKHPVFAFDMLSPIDYLKNAIDIPFCHHEKWDGTGYPRGLKGENIPLAARIFAVTDIWDALNSDRPYRPAWPREKIREYIHSLPGTHLDPDVVHVFLESGLV